MNLKIMSSTATGIVLGIALVVACGDDDAQPTDASADAAAVCDCPASEPPLRDRITLVEVQRIDDGALAPQVSASCGDGIVLGVVCDIQRGESPQGDTRNMVFVASNVVGNGAFCTWRSEVGDPTRFLLVTKATCLMPAAQ